jgi:general secretion pathway protein H
MPISATGTSISSRRRARAAAGFTLVELLVVIVIIGILIAGALLSLDITGRDSQLQQESERLTALLDYVRERGELQTLEYGLRLQPYGYSFSVYDPRSASWAADSLDEVLRARQLPAGLQFSLDVEGRTVVLDEPGKDSGLRDAPPDQTPQVMLFSNGDTNDFELRLARPEAGRQVRFQSQADGMITVSGIEEAVR